VENEAIAAWRACPIAGTYRDTAPTVNISQDFDANGRTEIHYGVTTINSLHHANPIVDTRLSYIYIFASMIVYFTTERQKTLREAQPKTSSSVTLPLRPNGRAQSGACIQSITVSGRIERVADTGKPNTSRHGLRAIKTDLEFLIERISKLDSEGVGAQTALHYRRERRAGDRLDRSARGRDRLLLAGVGPAAVSLAAPSDLDGRDLPVVLIFEVPTTLCEVDAVGVGGWATFATGLRPSPSSFAKAEFPRSL